MQGFEGDPSLVAVLHERLEGLLDVFREHLAKARSPRFFDAEELAKNELFDAILRAHKKSRLGIPVQALRATGAAHHHGFAQMQLRRLAWFVPTLLAAWLERAPGSETARARADSGARAPPRRRGAGLVPAFTFGAARRAPRSACVRVPLEDLVVRWALSPSPLAADHLLEAAFDTEIASKHYLSHEAVADRLGETFFEATGERAQRISKAEAIVRRNIERRGAY